MRTMAIGLAVVALGAAGIVVWLTSHPSPPPSPGPKLPPPEPRIVQFYAYPPVVSAGEGTTLCYGVENVDSVRIEPPVGDLSPSPNRCISVSPARTTAYRLIARTAAGRELTAGYAVRVQARRAPKEAAEPAPSARAQTGIEFFRANPAEAAAGQTVTFCYAASHATGVRIDPPIVSFNLPERGCFGYVPKQTATYTLTATGPEGTATSTLTVTVK